MANPPLFEKTKKCNPIANQPTYHLYCKKPLLFIGFNLFDVLSNINPLSIFYRIFLIWLKQLSAKE